MGQVRHRSATTTHAVRAAIQRSQASVAELSRELGVNPKTLAKWRKRQTVEDQKTGPKGRVQRTGTSEPIIAENVDTLVSAHALAPVSDLPETLTDFPGLVVPIGDCLSPRSCEEAVYEGLKAAVELDQ